jgi:rhodanese-related sulfurtransferase
LTPETRNGFKTKQQLIDYREDSVSKVDPDYTASFRWPVVMGEDPGGGYQFGSSFYFATTYQSQKITSAPLSAAHKNEKTVPSAPRNLTVDASKLDSEGRVDLAWDAPLTDGGRPITKYQVYYSEGGQDWVFRWLDLPATARSCYFTNLQPGVQYYFTLRAVNDIDNARWFGPNTGGDSNMTDAPLRGPVRIPKIGLQPERVVGHGGWACADSVTKAGRISMINGNHYPQLNDQPIKLYWGNPVLQGTDEKLYGKNGAIYDYQMNLISDSLKLPVVKANYFTAIVQGNSPFLTWKPIDGADDYMVYVYDQDPERNPGAAPIADRLATSPVAPGITNPALGPMSYEFDRDNPRFYLFANFFTTNKGLTHGYDVFRTEDYLPPGDYWFRVQALPASGSALKDSALSISVGPFHSFYDPDAAEPLMRAGVAGIDYLLVSLRGEDEEKQQGQIKGQFSVHQDWFGYSDAALTPSGVVPPEVQAWDKAKPIIVFCLGGNRSHNAAVRLAKEGYTNVINIGGINQWQYGRDLSAAPNFDPLGPTNLSSPYGPPLPLSIVGDKLIYGSLVDNVEYNVYAFANATDVTGALASETLIPAYGFFTPTGVSPQTSLMAAEFDLTTLSLTSGTNYYIRVQAVDTRAFWGASSELSSTPIPYTPS